MATRRNPTAAIPVELRSALAGRPTVGDWDVMFPWLTIDDAGFPHVCLLSRAELDADRDRVHAVLASPTTISNLRRHPQATLVAIDEHAATYAKLTVARGITDGSWLGVTCTLASVKRDGLPIPLQPPRYLATDTVAASEDWQRAAQLLTRLASLRD
ncbi:MAG: hypothetical protein QOI75_3102 [Pseudonocardiales bacterium]|jgi:hypothetical protein|nr:hypothetical protein [Pseudonocardiales bacterium]